VAIVTGPLYAMLINVKAEQWVIQFYCRKISLHQQKILVVLFFSFIVVEKIFEKVSKMKLLGTYQLLLLS